MKRLQTLSIFFIVLLFFNNKGIAQSKSDSVDVINYTINLSITDFADDTIIASAQILFSPKVNNFQHIALDLLKFEIDSIFYLNQQINNYSYNDTLLNITLPQVLNTDDTSELTIYYHGMPTLEPYGWGGVHLDPSIAYNLGVAFDANPHNYGRGWFPCIDEFVDRAKYNFNITTKNPNTAVCNGLLTDKIAVNDSLTLFKWRLNQEIPTYLACFAVSNYIAVNDTFNSILGEIPISIFVSKADSLKAKNSFVNLKTIMQGYEKYWGAYRWDRIGYVSTPKGAMEHPTSIAMPTHTITGDLTYEWLYYHELAHSWFGDQITCSTEGDMWLNEGWATFNESFFNEILYGKTAYKTYMRAKHKSVLQSCHKDDGGYFSLINLPHSITYGSTAYDKGAGVVHTLRNYMGDTLFFNSVKTFLSQNAFKPISSEELRIGLTAISGIDLTDFFNAWVYSQGFPHFSVDSFNVIPNGNTFETKVFVKQKLNHSTNLANSNKVEITFKGANWEEHTETIYFSGENGSQTFQLPFYPLLALADKEEKIADATIENNILIKNTGNYNLSDIVVKLNVTSCPDSSYIRITHNFVAPDNQNPISGLFLSDYHYWKVEGIFANGFHSKLLLQYNSSLFDNTLITNVADSLVVVYRPNTASNWKIANFTRIGGATGGQFTVDTLKNGEYALGIWDYDHVSIIDYQKKENSIEVFPNPTKDEITIQYPFNNEMKVEIFDISGHAIEEINTNNTKNAIQINTRNYKKGVYFIIVKNTGRSIATAKFLKL